MTGTFHAKKMLLVLELNQVLFYIHNAKSAYKNPLLQTSKIQYEDAYDDQYKISYRRGRTEFLNTMLAGPLVKEVDLAIWSNLPHKMAMELSLRYFNRFFKNLLFVIPTNRELYTSSQNPQTPIKTRKNLAQLYHKFPGYTAHNTFVITGEPNLLTEHASNDIIVPLYNPGLKDMQFDAGASPIARYVQGLLTMLEEDPQRDLRHFASSKSIIHMFDRIEHRMFSEKIYK